MRAEGEKFVSCLVDLMWYINGHHDIFKHRFNTIPASVAQFSEQDEKPFLLLLVYNTRGTPILCVSVRSVRCGDSCTANAS